MVQILVVDDELAIRELLLSVLRSAGHEAVGAPDGQSALLTIANSQRVFDLLICDVLIPGMNGHELTARVAAICPETRILHISGYDPGCSTCPYIKQCPLVRKPFDINRVLEAVETLLAVPPVPPMRLGAA